jgi:tRNA pseudouridine55 synthase
LNAAEAGRFLTGMRIRPRVHHDDQDRVKVFGPPVGVDTPGQRRFLGTAHVVANEVIPSRLLSPLEVQSQVQIHVQSAHTN